MAPRDLTRTLQRSLEHLRAPRRAGGQHAATMPTHFRPTPAFVQQKDRIAYWHIAPGDRVTVIKGGEQVKGRSGIVDRVERESNRVYLKEPEFSVKKRQPSQYPGEALSPNSASGSQDATFYTPRPFHISNVRLQVEDAGKKYTSSRVRRSKVSWDRQYRRFSWKRYALVVELAAKENHDGWVHVPWPEETIVKSEPGPLDATENEIMTTTWQPASADQLASARLPPRTAYTAVPALSDAVPELNISPIDLHGHWNSRARRTERYNAMKEVEKELSRLGLGETSKQGRRGPSPLNAGEVELL